MDSSDWYQVWRPVAVAVERVTSSQLEIYKQIPEVDKMGSLKVYSLSTSPSSPEL